MGVVRLYNGASDISASRHTLHLLAFFSQAEDGIRDTSVTGVQTCALPISKSTFLSLSGTSAESASNHSFLNSIRCCRSMARFDVRAMMASPIATLPWQRGIGRSLLLRSEERRVGTEVRATGWREACWKSDR